MPDIKIRDVVKGTVKVIDKSAVAAERMKDAYVRTKDKAEHSVFAAESSPEEYAADRTLTAELPFVISSNPISAWAITCPLSAAFFSHS